MNERGKLRQLKNRNSGQGENFITLQLLFYGPTSLRDRRESGGIRASAAAAGTVAANVALLGFETSSFVTGFDKCRVAGCLGFENKADRAQSGPIVVACRNAHEIGLKDNPHSNQIDDDIVSTQFSRKSNHSAFIFAYHSCARLTGSIVPDGARGPLRRFSIGLWASGF